MLDVDEIALLVEPLIPALRRYAYALTWDHALADDLVQDCLERAVARWHQRREGGDVKAWLLAILRNVHIDHHHRERRQGQRVALDESTNPTVRPSQEDGLALSDLLSALDGLSEDHRALLLLVGVEDLSYAEAAEVLGVPVGTVMSRLSRARARFRLALEIGRVVPLRSVR